MPYTTRTVLAETPSVVKMNSIHSENLKLLLNSGEPVSGEFVRVEDLMQQITQVEAEVQNLTERLRDLHFAIRIRQRTQEKAERSNNPSP